MPVTASRLFDFLAERPSCSIERHEIALAAFSGLRRSLRSMIIGLDEGGDWEAKEVAGRLRTVISEWLTVPVRFDGSVIRILSEMGEPSAIETRWGRDIRRHFEEAYSTTRELMTRENPVRADLANSIQAISKEGRSFRIFCHRQARKHFDSLVEEFEIAALSEQTFIHSVAQYRETEPFGVLLKIGPLRSRGWGSAPDAILTAPRFDTLIQTVWSGCGDDPSFGYDPVAPLDTEGGSQGQKMIANRFQRSLHLNWTVIENRSHDSSISVHGDITDVNDLDIFTQLAKPIGAQRATLVQVDDAHGILYPPHSRVLSSDFGLRSICYRLPGESLLEGMYVIVPIVNDVRLAGLQAEEGQFSRLWKDKLNTEYHRDPDDLVRRLQVAGLRLLQLRSRIEHWCKAPSTVIHAPQQMQHFEILIKVLGLDFDPSQQTHRPRAAWWQFAWDEIRRARGEAILTGFHEQQIIDEQLLKLLQSLNTEIQANVGQQMFQIPIPQTEALRGVFRFYRVLAVEEGFQAPQNDLKMLCELSRIDQWRA